MNFVSHKPTHKPKIIFKKFPNASKKYHLTLKISVENQFLVIQLTDNGEGFEFNTSKPASKAMNIIRERLHLIDPVLADSFTFSRKNQLTIVCFKLPFLTV